MVKPIQESVKPKVSHVKGHSWQSRSSNGSLKSRDSQVTRQSNHSSNGVDVTRLVYRRENRCIDEVNLKENKSQNLWSHITYITIQILREQLVAKAFSFLWRFYIRKRQCFVRLHYRTLLIQSSHLLKIWYEGQSSHGRWRIFLFLVHYFQLSIWVFFNFSRYQILYCLTFSQSSTFDQWEQFSSVALWSLQCSGNNTRSPEPKTWAFRAVCDKQLRLILSLWWGHASMNPP